MSGQHAKAYLALLSVILLVLLIVLLCEGGTQESIQGQHENTSSGRADADPLRAKTTEGGDCPDGIVPAVSLDERAPWVTESEIPVRILDTLDGKPIPSALVLLGNTASRDTPVPVESNSHGWARVPKGTWNAVILKRGYGVSARTDWEPERDEVIHLAELATLRLGFQSPRGEPLVGIEATIVDPLGGQLIVPAPALGALLQNLHVHRRMLESLRRLEDVEALASVPFIKDVTLASGSSGSSIFTLRAGHGYRWALDHRPLPPRMEPPHEIQAIEASPESGILLTCTAPRNLSGEFSLSSGRTTEYRVVLPQGLRVRGSIEAAKTPNPDASQVRLYEYEEIPEGTSSAGHCEIEATALLDSSGVFEFENVSPGWKLLRCRYSPRPHQYVFRSLVFRAEPGRDVELGDISARPNTCAVRGLVRLVDPDGNELDPRDTLEVAQEGQDPIVRILVSWCSDSGHVAELLGDRIEVPIGCRFELAGGMPGNLHLRVLDELHWPARLLESVQRPDPITAHVPETDFLALDYVFRRTLPGLLSVSIPPHEERVKLRIVILDETGEMIYTTLARIARDAAMTTLDLALPPGSYGIFAFSDSVAAGDQTPSLYSHMSIHYGGGNTEISIRCTPAAVLRGQVEPSPHVTFPTKVRGFVMAEGEEGPAAMGPEYKVYTTEDGLFEFIGLPPHTAFRIGDRHVELGGANEVRWITVRL